jgi:hypothetical protein
MVPRLQVGYPLAALLNFAGRFVTKNHGHWPRSIGIDNRKVGMTETGSLDFYQQLSGPRRVKTDFLKLQWLRNRVGTRQPHFS